MSIRSILIDFVGFLKQPDHRIEERSASFLVSCTLFLSFSLIRFAGILLEVNGFRPLVLYYTGQELARQQTITGLSALVIGALVMAPLMEETAYRWGLRFSPVRTAVSLGLIAFYWLPYGGTYSGNLNALTEPGFYLMLGMALVVGLTVYSLLRIPAIEARVQAAWERHFGWVFYGSVLLFGLMHIFNVREITWIVIGLAPFITFQQIVLGLFNGYVRMRFGLGQAIIQHALFNAIPVIIQVWR